MIKIFSAGYIQEREKKDWLIVKMQVEGQLSNRNIFFVRSLERRWTSWLVNFFIVKRQLVSAFSSTLSELTCSSSVETLVSTAETLPYVDGVAQELDVRSNPSTISLLSDSEEEIELLSHHVTDVRPPAPYTVISETRIDDNGETNANEIQATSEARRELVF